MRAAVFVLFGLLVGGACGGSSMQEAEADVYASEGRVVSEVSEEPTPPPPREAPAADPDRDEYLRRLTEALLTGWERPRRPSNMPPREATVTLQLDPRGHLLQWQFRRRSTDGVYNRGLEAHLDSVVETSPVLPLPPQGSALWAEAVGDGVLVTVGDRR